MTPPSDVMTQTPRPSKRIPDSGSPSAAAAPVVITIDGPAGTGKSTVAHLLAKRLGLEFLDTGAMYRAAALISIEQNIDASNPEAGAALAGVVSESNMHFDWKSDPPKLLVGDRDVTDRIRDMDVSSVVSHVAARPEVRAVLVAQQREIAARHPRLVTEGRDQGSIVFPRASVRFFLHANVDVRARRRQQQLAAAGKLVDPERIVRDIQKRDLLDASRTDGPLVRPQGAIDIDTGDRTIDEVVSAMEQIVRSEIPTGGFKT